MMDSAAARGAAARRGGPGYKAQLLVSVRSASEAEAALAGGADVIDVKEPRRGALGPADPAVWRAVQRAVGRRAVVSAALGELWGDSVFDLARSAGGLRFAKVGLAGCQGRAGWIERWIKVVRALPAAVDAVPVAYADWTSADAPAPSVAVALAAKLPGRLLLVDTFEKSAGTLLEVVSRESLLELVAHAGAVRVRLALAGSLDEAGIEELFPLTPAYFGVRGAACAGGRDGSIEIARVKSLAQLVRTGGQVAAG